MGIAWYHWGIRARARVVRGAVKVTAASAVGKSYGLGTQQTPAEVTARAAEPLNFHIYIYPVDERGRVLDPQPYRHSIITPLLRELFFEARGNVTEHLSGALSHVRFSAATSGENIYLARRVVQRYGREI
ncbi:hypothetical protein BOTBODRAFT_499125 [Botryobasidium botryosum FD-172 SS1]|uniref:DUF6532 domain-containing protein n=1 Tax=Botryobasidium botryosum (strain FD-172 SS1) TaxID=930990 RepID=A0A067M3M4_BOTB1|nr:hypothetical protein BOTBODRAFT_499125 [Botryobasidium botryosum FD-172 SS1]